MINYSSRNDYGVVNLDIVSLVDYYNADRFTGALKELASTLDEEDNGVVMVLKFK
ncbi:hypothetical protein M2480_001833 [Parabacteroides sp. PFB2-12]|nr:hypothetical protein [Parabacteroides sp. PM6-13]MDH6390851.1 hypothetical protein [Parabacteroides sp. PFB2-12]